MLRFNLGLFIAGIVLVALGITGLVRAQDTYAEPVAEKIVKSPALKDFEDRLNRSGAVQGPVNIIVFPSDKGATGQKYTNVPYFQFLGNSIIAFPVGKPDRFGNQEYIYASNFTIQVLPRINPRERTK